MERGLAEIVVENGLVYHLAEDGCYYPDISVEQNTEHLVGKYGMLRGEYLLKNDRHRYFRMVLNGTWNEYLYRVNEEWYRELEMAVKRIKEKEEGNRGFKEREPYAVGWKGQ